MGTPFYRLNAIILIPNCLGCHVRPSAFRVEVGAQAKGESLLDGFVLTCKRNFAVDFAPERQDSGPVLFRHQPAILAPVCGIYLPKVFCSGAEVALKNACKLRFSPTVFLRHASAGTGITGHLCYGHFLSLLPQRGDDGYALFVSLT